MHFIGAQLNAYLPIGKGLPGHLRHPCCLPAPEQSAPLTEKPLLISENGILTFTKQGHSQRDREVHGSHEHKEAQ